MPSGTFAKIVVSPSSPSSPWLSVSAASTVVFSVAYNVFFHTLLYRDFDRSVVFEIRNTANVGGLKGRAYFSPEEFRAFREQNHVFEDVIAQGVVSRLFYYDGKSTRVLPRGETVTTNTFDYLGVPRLLGRTILEEDGRPGALPVFVMSYRLWQREFAGDPRILGKSFIMRGTPMMLVGIMPARFNAFGASLWMSMRADEAGGHLIGRLKPGASVEAAGAELDAIAQTILCGLAPTLHVVRGDVQPHLTSSGTSTGGGLRHGTLRAVLVVAEVALSIVLLNGAGLLMRSFLVLTRVDLRFNPKNLLYFELVWPDSYNFNWSHPASIVEVRTRKNSVTRRHC
jgi:hypothetical protein